MSKSKLINDYYTLREEIAHSITHGIGVLLSVVGLIVLLTFTFLSGDRPRWVSCLVYGLSLILLYLASTLYHAVQHPPAKRIFRLLDHAAIYLLIAGTYTPLLLIAVGGTLGWGMFAIIWGLALLGIIFEVSFVNRYRLVSILAYVGMGWSCVVVWQDLTANVPAMSSLLLVLGGVTYTAGVIFYVWDKMPYNHAVWHLFVLGGSITHYFAILPLAFV